MLQESRKYDTFYRYAVASHSNRCLSIIKTGKMEKMTDIEYNERTVWTLAVHPFDSRFIATGNMGGQVAVFKYFVSGFVCSRAKTNKTVLLKKILHYTRIYQHFCTFQMIWYIIVTFSFFFILTNTSQVCWKHNSVLKHWSSKSLSFASNDCPRSFGII